MNNRFTVELSSDLDYENMVVNISFDGMPISTINCEKGMSEMELEISPIDTDSVISIPYDDYLNVLEFAKKILIQSKKRD